MTNAEKFRGIFKEFATEVWAFPEKDFLTWLNAEYKEPTIRNCFGCKYSKDNHNSGTEECHLCMWENQYTPTTKNNLEVDCIKKSDAINIIQDMHGLARADVISDAVNRIITMPTVTPQEQQTFKWCTDCKEYDQEKHCCHRWSKVIRDTVEEMKQEQETVSKEVYDHEYFLRK